MKTIRRIKSEDIGREQRIPPGQIKTNKWPVLHYGPVPEFLEESWDFKVIGLVNQPFTISYQELLALDRVEVESDIHCVTTWSKLDNLWEGVSVHELIQKAGGLKAEAKFVIAHCEYGFTTNLPIKDFLQEDVLLALKHNGENLTPDHGYPLRLVVPQLYFWKSAKWLRALEFSATDKPGFWERNGYHNRGNPWTEERMWV
ncbi:MAG: sulfite oxidase-like oxidoreductase [Candidatus Cloacimonetes bacterium]|nr:sulfite oxidase-like oxidoreductase [Candidatus Cloacimonadota bacterium]